MVGRTLARPALARPDPPFPVVCVPHPLTPLWCVTLIVSPMCIHPLSLIVPLAHTHSCCVHPTRWCNRPVPLS